MMKRKSQTKTEALTPSKKVEEGKLEPGLDRDVYCMTWTESEAGWGQRPDGFSLHFSKEAAERFSKKLMADQHEFFVSRGLQPGRTPREYSYSDGSPYLVKNLSRELMTALYEAEAKGEDGIRSYERETPERASGSWDDDLGWD